MTRRHFEMIAQVIRKHRDFCERDFNSNGPVVADRMAAQIAMADRIAESLADELANENPRFDRARFLAACGVEDN